MLSSPSKGSRRRFLTEQLVHLKKRGGSAPDVSFHLRHRIYREYNAIAFPSLLLLKGDGKGVAGFLQYNGFHPYRTTFPISFCFLDPMWNMYPLGLPKHVAFR